MVLMMSLLGELPRMDAGMQPLDFLRQHNRLTIDASGELTVPEPVRRVNRALAEQARKLAAKHPDAYPSFFAARAEEWLEESKASTRVLAGKRIHGYLKWYAGLLPFLKDRNVSVSRYIDIATEQGLAPLMGRSLGSELARLTELSPQFVEAFLRDAQAADTREVKLLKELAALDLLWDVWDERGKRNAWPEAPPLQQALRAGPRKVHTRADARSELLAQLLKSKPHKAMFYWSGALVSESNGDSVWVPFPDALETKLTDLRLPVSGSWP
jgi:hypothetical protein